jgi:Zn/Cd-binding protein ZinT
MSKETNSKEKTDKKDEDVAAKNKDLQDLKGEVGIVKKYITDKTAKETADAAAKAVKDAKEAKATKEKNYESNRLSKNIKGLGSLSGLNLGLGQQSFKK